MTRLRAYFEEAVASLWRNRVRSALTMLGMIIGSASIIAVFGISKAATSGIDSTFASFGQQPVLVSVDDSQDYPQFAQIHYRDLAAVKEALGNSVISVLPYWQRTLTVAFGSKRANLTVNPSGSFDSDGLTLGEGRRISHADVLAAARVVVITQDLATKYFDGSAVGKFLRISGGRYQVIGVLQSIQGSFFSGIAGGSTLFVPYTTYRNNLTSDPMDYLALYPTDPLDAGTVSKVAIAALQHIHGTRAKYSVQDTADQLKIFTNVLGIVALGLSVIGGVALVVAGIGIMNIMLVSVTERTREIGIRKAIGANRNDIALQFLMESVLLSLCGGGIGMAIGLLTTIGVASILSKQLGTLLIPYLLIVSIAIGFSLLIGTVFGTYPALRAAKLDPIEALRS